MADQEMDDLQHHFLSHLIHHRGTPDELIDKVVASAGSEAEHHRHTMLGWVDNLLKAGHITNHGNTITAGEASRLEYQNMVRERRWDLMAAERMGGMQGMQGMQIYDLFPYNQR